MGKATHYKNLEDIKSKVKTIWGDKYTILDDDTTFTYKNVHQHVRFRCNVCGKEYQKRINSLLHGYPCKYCSGRYFENADEMKEYVSKSTCGEYELISNTYKTRDKGIFRHNSKDCKNDNPDKTFEMKLHNFTVLKQRCPFCNNTSLGIILSKGNIKIREYLNMHNIKFEAEKRINECRNENNELLSFDLFVPEFDLLIEFDGIQHRQPVKYFGGEETFKRQQLNDIVKNNFIESQDKYKLLRISDLEFSKIDQILEETFNDYRKNSSEEISG